MAPMWEAMGKPLLPQFAKAFANQLKDEIEKSLGVDVTAETGQAGTGIWAWLKRLWRRLFGKPA